MSADATRPPRPARVLAFLQPQGPQPLTPPAPVVRGGLSIAVTVTVTNPGTTDDTPPDSTT